MKIALITDQHFGIRNDSKIILENQEKFYNNIFFKTLQENDINTVIDLGDTFDKRKYINFFTFEKCKKIYFDELKKRKIKLHCIIGNHSTYFKNTNSTNSPKLLLSGYNNITIYDNIPVEVVFDSTSILMIPWICDENRETTFDIINKSKSHIVMGHLELNGYEMYRGHVSDHGDDPRIFDKFDLVCSGHFHTKSNNGSIHYLGTPTQYNWSDYNDTKGFHILDTNTRQLTFIENNYNIFHKLYYDDTNKTAEEILNFDPTSYKNCYIKMIVKNKTNPYVFDMLVDKIEKVGIADLQIIEEHLNLDITDNSDIINETEDTMSIIKNYISSMNLSSDRKRVENIIQSLYTEAHEIV